MWRRNPRGRPFLGVCLLAVFAILLAPVWPRALAQTSQVTATVETDPVPSDGDAADDAAIWVHPEDPALSTVIGTDKEGGLAVYDLSGNQIQYISNFLPNNVDLRHGFALGGQEVDLVVTSDRSDQTIAIHRVDPSTRQLVEVATPIDSGIEIYGVCMYRSPQTGDFYVFATPDDEGPVRQWRLTDNGSGGVAATQMRDLQMDSTAEGCVADDELGYLYVAEEAVGIWKYGAEPDAGTNRAVVDQVGTALDADVEGVTIYYGDEGQGYLIASSQGSDGFAAYERSGDNAHVTNFQIVDSGSIDGASGTDGIDVISTPLGSGFPNGLFVAQDGDNDSQNQNFKLVPWEIVAGSQSPALSIFGNWTPRGERPTGVTPAPIAPDSATPAPAVSPQPATAWALASASVAAADDDEVTGAASADVLTLGSDEEVTIRFSGLDMERGSNLRRAHLQFTAVDDGSDPVVISIHAMTENSETEPVTWAPGEWADGQRGAYQRSPDISSVLREVMSDAEWEPGTPITLVMRVEGDGTRAAASFETDPAAAPSLSLEHSAGS